MLLLSSLRLELKTSIKNELGNMALDIAEKLRLDRKVLRDQVAAVSVISWFAVRPARTGAPNT